MCCLNSSHKLFIGLRCAGEVGNFHCITEERVNSTENELRYIWVPGSVLGPRDKEITNPGNVPSLGRTSTGTRTSCRQVNLQHTGQRRRDSEEMLWCLGVWRWRHDGQRKLPSAGETQEKKQPSKPLTSELSSEEGRSSHWATPGAGVAVCQACLRQEEACMAGVRACHMIAGPSAMKMQGLWFKTY